MKQKVLIAAIAVLFMASVSIMGQEPDTKKAEKKTKVEKQDTVKQVKKGGAACNHAEGKDGGEKKK